MNTIECHQDLKTMMDSIEIKSALEYSLFGEPRNFSAAAVPAQQPGESVASASSADSVPSDVGPPPVAETLNQANSPVTREGDSPVFMSYLETELYSHLYVRPSASAGTPSDSLAMRDHTAALSAANSGTGSWEPGWKIVEVERDGSVAVMRDQVTFWVPRTGLRTRASKLRRGDYCRVWVSKELRQLVPGFYFAIGNGDRADDRDATGPLVRFYWNLTVGAAVQYMQLATGLLNEARIPFRTKVLSDPSSYVRADSGVLYVEQRHFRVLCPLVTRIHEAITTGLREDVPMFAKRLAPGLGLAEDPNNGLSFGQSRCNAVARAAWLCHLRGIDGADERLRLLGGEVKKDGINPGAPFLNSGSMDIYDLTGAPAATTARLNSDTAGRSGHRKRGSAKKRKYKAASR
jgi:hypothetical protein